MEKEVTTTVSNEQKREWAEEGRVFSWQNGRERQLTIEKYDGWVLLDHNDYKGNITRINDRGFTVFSFYLGKKVTVRIDWADCEFEQPETATV